MLSTEFSIPVSVEVSVADVLQGIFEIEGLLNCADESLTIEYQTKEAFSRGGRVELVELTLDSLREVIFKRGVSGATITLLPKRLSAFKDVRISSKGQIVLKVKRGYRPEAEALVSQIQRVLSYKSIPAGEIPIPFRCRDVGLREIKGALYLEDDEFLVFDLENALMGEFDTQHHVIKIAPQALRDIRLDEGRFRDQLYILPKNRDLLDAMPGSHTAQVELKVRRKYRDHVARLIYEVDRLKNRSLAAGDEPANASDHADA